MTSTSTQLEPIDLSDSRVFLTGVPYEWFAWLRDNDPVHWQDEPNGPGFWAVTRYDDCVNVNRDYTNFSSSLRTALPFEIPNDAVEQHRLMMLNMDPPLHTRYRRLVNKGFTPRMIAQLESSTHATCDRIIDQAISKYQIDGVIDFVTDLAAELPLQVIAELLGVPLSDRHLVFDWSNKMVGQEDYEYQLAPGAAEQASLELFNYATQLFDQKRGSSHADLMTALTEVEIDGERLNELELELFFLLLTIAGNETTRNLIAGGINAFFDFPDQFELLSRDPTLLRTATEEMLRFVSPVICFRRTLVNPYELRDKLLLPKDKVVFYHASANRDERIFTNPETFDITRDPNPHIAFGGGGPHFCLGANLARMEIRIFFEHLLDRLPQIHPVAPLLRLQSQFINGIKHLPVALTD